MSPTCISISLSQMIPYVHRDHYGREHTAGLQKSHIECYGEVCPNKSVQSNGLIIQLAPNFFSERMCL